MEGKSYFSYERAGKSGVNMKCENCKVAIRPEFSHAISNNQCPACGKPIMKQAKLASFLSLRTLLSNNLPEKGVDIDKIASLVVANFEIKQLFREDGADHSDAEEVDEVFEVREDDPDADYKKAQMEKSKEILAKMRDEALNGALNDRYGFSEGLLLPEEDATMHETVNAHKIHDSRENILNGSDGSFTRNG